MSSQTDSSDELADTTGSEDSLFGEGGEFLGTDNAGDAGEST
jgi:hypothetical protein